MTTGIRIAATPAGGTRGWEQLVVTHQNRLAYRWIQYHLFFHGLFFLSIPLRTMSDWSGLRYVSLIGLFGIGVTGWVLWFLSNQRLGLLWMLTGWYLWMAVDGLYKQNWLTYWGVDGIFFLPIFAIGAGLHSGVINRTIQTYARILVLVTPYAALAMFFGMMPATGWQRLVGSMANFQTISIVMPGLYLIFFESVLSRFQRWTVYGAIALVGLFGVLTKTRGAILWPVQVLLLYGLVQKRRRFSSTTRGLIAFSAAFAASIVVWSPSQMEKTEKGLAARFETSDPSTGRNRELEDVMSQLHGGDFIMGRGLGGTYRFKLRGRKRAGPDHGRRMVHYAWAHLILKGGVILLLIITYVLAISIFRGFTVPQPYGRLAGAIVVLFVLLNGAHQQFSGSIMMPLAFVVSGYLLQPISNKIESCPS